MIPLLLALAHAAPVGGRGVMVNVVDPDGLLTAAGAPTVTLVDPAGASVATALANDGAPPDADAGDAVWAGRLDNVGGEAGQLTLQVGGRAFTAAITIQGGATPALTVRPAADGTLQDVSGIPLSDLVPHATAAPSGSATWNNTKVPMDAGTMRVGGTEPGIRPDAGWWIPWALGVVTVGAGVLWLRQLASRTPPGVPLGRPATARPTRRPLPEGLDPAAHIAALPVGTRTVYVGPALSAEPPPGTVWWAGPGRPVVDDLLALVRHLGEGGAPVVVVIAGPIEGAGGRRGADAIDHLFGRLPRGAELHVGPTA